MQVLLWCFYFTLWFLELFDQCRSPNPHVYMCMYVYMCIYVCICVYIYKNDMITALWGEHIVMCLKKMDKVLQALYWRKELQHICQMWRSLCVHVSAGRKYNLNNHENNFFSLAKHVSVLLLCFDWLNCCLLLSFCPLVLFKSFCWLCGPVLLLWVCVNDITQSAQSFGRTTDGLKFLCPQLSWSLQGCFQQSCLPVMSLTGCPHQNTHYRNAWDWKT